MSTSLSVVEARKNFSEIINRAAYARERFIIERRGKPMAAVISMNELRRYEEWEDTRDSQLLAKAIDQSSGEFYTIEEVLAEYEKATGVKVTLEELQRESEADSDV